MKNIKNLLVILSILTATILCPVTINASTTTKITVYYTFSSPTRLYLVPSTITIPYTVQPATEAIKQLILGPPSYMGLYTSIPYGTKLRGINIINSTAYVDFSNDILYANVGSEGEAALVYSIVNTLSQFSTVSKVQILVEGNKVESLAGHILVEEPLNPDYSMLIKNFKDMPSHWASGYVNALRLRNIINGYPDGYFRPKMSVSRAEFAKLLVKANYEEVQLPNTPTFSDVPVSHWAYEYIEAAVERGIIVADDYGQYFYPDTKLPRREMAVWLARANDLENRAGELVGTIGDYKDLDQQPDWAVGYIAAVTEAGLMNGYPDKTFRPYGVTSRAEASTVISRVLYLGKEHIFVAAPKDGETIGSTRIGILGCARVFEGTVNYSIYNDYEEVADSYCTATSGEPYWGFFSAIYDVDLNHDVKKIQIYAMSPVDGSRIYVTEIAVN